MILSPLIRCYWYRSVVTAVFKPRFCPRNYLTRIVSPFDPNKYLVAPRIMAITTAAVESQIAERFEKIVIPEEDERKYLGLRLKNDLKVLLISDPETDISAASLSVHVGSMSDPWPIQGLAHFLEHMLFMGTKKYPSENEYSKFLSQHSGSSNAYTADSTTNFFFDVSPDKLGDALDRFAQFFLEPLMLEGSVNRELEAVNSEFEKNLKSDSWRMMQLKQTIGDPKHDFYKFNIGNYETLRDQPQKAGMNVREELLKFYRQWYSSNIMCLCVYGKETLSELTNMVVPLFSAVANHSVTPQSWNLHPYHRDESRNKQVSVVPVKEKRTMEVLFVYPDETHHYKSSPGQYLSHLIGHESKGSLLSELKKRSLSSSLMSYYDCHKGFGFFAIVVDLTEKAAEQTDEVAHLIFQYINMLKSHGPREYVFDEMKGIEFIKFNFSEKINPIDYVSRLTAKLQDYPMPDVISAGRLLDRFQPDLIREHLEYLKPENCNIFLASKAFQGKTDSKEKYYGTDYKMVNISQELLGKLRNPGLNENLQFPEPNELIPSEFDLLECDSNKDPKAPPELIINTDFLRLWYLKDRIYKKPKVFYGFKMINPIVYTNPYICNVYSMLASLFLDSLNEYLYDASLAGLSFKIRPTSYGFDMEFHGYHHKMNVFMRKIFEKLIHYQVDPQRFEILKEKRGRELKSYRTQPLYQLANYYLQSVIYEQFWSYDDLIHTLDRMTCQSVQSAMESFFTNFSIEAFVHGNTNQNAVKEEVVGFLQNLFSGPNQPAPLRKFFHHSLKEVILDPGCYYTFEVVNDIQKPKAINLYFQTGFDDLAHSSRMVLLEQIFDEPFFDNLRTKEQLGYVVYSRSRDSNGVIGMNFVIQSDYSVDHLEDRVEAFLVWVKGYIETMTDQDFEAEKQSLITRLLKKKKRMIDYSRKLWLEIISQEYHFGKRERWAEAVRGLTKSDIVQFFNKYLDINSPERRKMVIKILKSDPEANKNLPHKNDQSNDLQAAPPRNQKSTPIQDVEEFLRYKQFHPSPKPKIVLPKK